MAGVTYTNPKLGFWKCHGGIDLFSLMILPFCLSTLLLNAFFGWFWVPNLPLLNRPFTR